MLYDKSACDSISNILRTYNNIYNENEVSSTSSLPSDEQQQQNDIPDSVVISLEDDEEEEEIPLEEMINFLNKMATTMNAIRDFNMFTEKMENEYDMSIYIPDYRNLSYDRESKRKIVEWLVSVSDSINTFQEQQQHNVHIPPDKIEQHEGGGETHLHTNNNIDKIV